jgi:hypothetical protein
MSERLTCERLVAELARIGARAEMPPLDEEIGRDRHFHAGARADQRGVVADAERRAADGPVEVPADDLELGRHYAGWRAR